MIRLRYLFPLLVVVLLAAPARADWASDYEDGMKAASAGDWARVVAKMTAAINAKPAENARMHTYGTIFIPYHPYYYRGIAYFNLGKYEEAVRDLRKATGEGKVKIGSAESFLTRAETQLAAAQKPAETPQVAQQPTQPTQAQPKSATPAIDPNLAPARSAARESIAAAEVKMTAAQRARATSVPEFARAQELLVDARTKATQADTASDWTAVAAIADRAISTFELAVTKSQIAAQQPKGAPATPAVASATEDALAAKRNEVRRAVQAYFSGEFQESVRAFDRLASRERDNALLWAFLGASHYYNWYLGGQRDDAERTAAIEAF
ncbi:MAG TPA: tetratricopeptide repeat protein, partial [Thermoanaerobaculia bacterium]